MNLRCLFLLPIVGLAALAADDAVELKAFRASVSYLYFHIECAPDSDQIAEIRVAWVAPKSTAEKSGLREGDRLLAIDGAPVTGKKRSEVMNQAGGIALRGHEVTFAGSRGFFRKNWSLTASIDARGIMEPKGDRKAPAQPPSPIATHP